VRSECDESDCDAKHRDRCRDQSLSRGRTSVTTEAIPLDGRCARDRSTIAAQPVTETVVVPIGLVGAVGTTAEVVEWAGGTAAGFVTPAGWLPALAGAPSSLSSWRISLTRPSW